ncbi:MAG TPA: PilW family protein [Pseudomonadales bacterium]
MTIHEGIRGSRSRSSGFSLVELLLALALGLVVVTGIVQLFVGNSQTYNILNGQARLQESARFALELISQAARSAGYFGCAPERNKVVKGLVANWEQLPEFDITRIIQGHDDVDGAWNPSWIPHTGGTAMVPGNAIELDDVVEGTDVVVFRGIQSPGWRLLEVLQPDGEPKIAAPGGNAGIQPNDVVMLADCEQGAVFRVSNVVVIGDEARLEYDTTTSTTDPYANFHQVQTPAGVVPFTLSITSRSYGPDATVGLLESTYFYVAQSEVGEDAAGNPVRSLWQKVGNQPPVELVQGIEDLQILYGVDRTLNNDVPNANAYVPFDELPDPDDPSSVVSLRVTVVANSVDPVTNDGQPLRRAFSKTILLRNANPEA